MAFDEVQEGRREFSGRNGETIRFQLRAGRRAFGQRLLDSGNRIEDVSVAMGHSSTKTTEGYYARNSENQVIKRILRNQTNNHR